MYSNLSVKRFVRELSSDKPYPGGGSAACLVGTLGISLGLMVGRIVRKKKKERGETKQVHSLDVSLRALSRLETAALRSIDGDVIAYKQVVQAYSLKKGTPSRAGRIEKALKQGYLFQKEFALLLVNAMHLQNSLERIAQGSIASDLVLSRHFLRASFLGACQTAKINLDYLKDKTFQTRELRVLSLIAKKFERAGK